MGKLNKITHEVLDNYIKKNKNRPCRKLVITENGNYREETDDEFRNRIMEDNRWW